MGKRYRHSQGGQCKAIELNSILSNFSQIPVMRLTLVSSLLLIVLCTSFQSPGPKHFTLKKIADGVWVAINNDNYGHAICNAGIVDIGDKTLIFDPFMNIDAAEELKQVAFELTKRQASIIINSHYHNDHIRGNQVFTNATIISTAWTRSEMAISEPKELAWEKKNAANILASYKKRLETATGKQKEELPLWIGYFEGMVINDPKVKTTLPNLTFTDSLWLYGTKLRVKLVECRDGHTGSDAVLEIPSLGIVFMGDLLFEQRHPYLGDGKWDSWKNHLKTYYDNTVFTTFLPGHGQLSQKEGLKNIMNYIDEVHDLVQTKIQKGLPDSVILKTPIPEAYRDWKFGQFFEDNLGYYVRVLKAK